MKKRPLLILAVIVIFAAVFIVFYQTMRQNETTVLQLQQSNLAVFQENCASCHGTSGEGFAAYPSLTGSDLSVDEIKHIIRNGIGDMPAFPDIQEPKLTQLAEFVDQL